MLKADSLTQVNNWYCEKMLELSDHMDPTTEAMAMLALAKKIPLSYQAQNEDHIVLDGLEDFGYMLDYLVDENNSHNTIKNYSKCHSVNTESESYRPKYTNKLLIEFNSLLPNPPFHTLYRNDRSRGDNTNF